MAAGHTHVHLGPLAAQQLLLSMCESGRPLLECWQDDKPVIAQDTTDKQPTTTLAHKARWATSRLQTGCHPNITATRSTTLVRHRHTLHTMDAGLELEVAKHVGTADR